MRIAVLTLLAVAAFAQPQVTQHMMLIEPDGVELSVSETLIISSGGGRGRVRIAVPPAAGVPGVRNGTLSKTSTPGVFDLATEASASETRVDLSWSIPFAVPETLSGRILHGGIVRLVFPKGVKVEGASLESNGVEPTTQASIFTLKTANYKIEIDGAGSLRAQQPPAESASDDGPSIQQIKPRIYDRLFWILGLTLAILAAGFALNYRKPPVNR
jgi:hypothetical protein